MSAAVAWIAVVLAAGPPSPGPAPEVTLRGLDGTVRFESPDRPLLRDAQFTVTNQGSVARTLVAESAELISFDSCGAEPNAPTKLSAPKLEGLTVGDEPRKKAAPSIAIAPGGLLEVTLQLEPEALTTASACRRWFALRVRFRVEGEPIVVSASVEVVKVNRFER